MAQTDTQVNERTDYEPDTKGVLEAVAEECRDLKESGDNPWIEMAPTTDEQEEFNRERQREAEKNNVTGIILGNYIDEAGRLGEKGEEYPIKGGFKMETRENSDEEVYEVWRTSKYNVHYRITTFEHPEFGEVAVGLVYVRLAEGYRDEE